eukprot:TRINITY_DN516_c0_g2_i1.p1 TRINITY_DN516_c0_g2~~TRINITY_DN516_c0_g2_i1.p1  ORF type:complete len:115 (+),score=15.78 TRINITY_DN516_c0_g2_i1:228-572(+)
MKSIITALLIILSVISVAHSLPGGLSHTKHADAKVISIAESVRADLESKVNHHFEIFDPISYRTQVVAGKNYFIKVFVGDEYIHIRVFQGLGSTEASLADYQTGHTESDPILYF